MNPEWMRDVRIDGWRARDRAAALREKVARLRVEHEALAVETFLLMDEATAP